MIQGLQPQATIQYREAILPRREIHEQKHKSNCTRKILVWVALFDYPAHIFGLW